MRNVLIVSGVYIATVIGAGFASGQELVSFFIKYGNISLIGAAAVSVLLGLALYVLLERCRQSGISDFMDYLKYSAGQRCARFLDALISVFMLCVFGTMIACAGTVTADITGISMSICALAVCVVCFVCFCFDLRGLAAVNAALSPVIIAGITGVCLYVLFFRETAVFSQGIKRLTDNIVISSLGYTSYNLLTAAVIAADMSRMIKTRREAVLAGRTAGIFFFIMIMLLWTVIKIYYGKIELGSIPMLTIAAHEGNILKWVYIAVLSAAVMTTAFSSGFGAVMRVRRTFPFNKYLCIMLVCAAGFLLSGLGFSELVENVYRICGVTGIALLFIILKDFVVIKNQKTEIIDEKQR